MSVGQRAKGPRQQGKGFGGERKEERTHKQGKGYRIGTEGEKEWNGTERAKDTEGIGTGSRALGKEYRTHGCHESGDMW